MKSFLLRGVFVMAQFALVGVAGYVSFEWLMRSMVHSRPEIEVPDLKGKNLRQAITAVSKAGLALSLEGEEHAPETAVGAVVKQYPVAGSKVREGKIVSIVTSIGSEKISVPELASLPLRQAEIEIKSSQLVLGETSEIYSLQEPRGSVINQEPKALSLAEKGDLVHLTISLGEPPANKLIIPDFTGADIDRVNSWAKQNNVTLNTFDDWSATDAADGKVTKQSLKADTIYDKNRLEESGLKMDDTVSRRAIKEASGRFLEYKVPAKPARKREVSLKILSQGAEKETFKTTGQPGENIRIPISKDWHSVRARIYVDGIFTEERTIE